MLSEKEAAELQRQITTLLNLWRLEPFYFRDVPLKYKQEFEICRTSPPGSIEFEPKDLPLYNEWLDALVQSNMINHNGPPHLAAVAVAINLGDVLNKFLMHENSHFPSRQFLLGHLQPINDKAKRLFNFFDAYETEHFKLTLETLLKINDLKRAFDFHKNSEDFPQLITLNHHYVTVMESLIGNRDADIFDPIVLRLAIHHARPAFLKDLLTIYPNAIKQFKTEAHKTGLVEYTIQCWLTYGIKNHKKDERHTSEILQILSKYGADLNDASNMLHHDGVPRLIEKTLSAMHHTKSTFLTQSFIAPQRNGANHTESSTVERSPDMSLYL